MQLGTDTNDGGLFPWTTVCTRRIRSFRSIVNQRRSSRDRGTAATTKSGRQPITMPTCVGCDQRIVDQYLLRVAPDLEWHAACLKCADCGQPLDETRTCFVRDGKTYCRQDYQRLVYGYVAFISRESRILFGYQYSRHLAPVPWNIQGAVVER